MNLIPIMDTMVTLIAFLLSTMAFLSIVSIESPFPESSPEQVAQKLTERPIQLTVSVNEKETEIWSPFEKFATKTIPHAPDGLPDILAIHAALFSVKQQFPSENRVIFAPFAGTSYDTLIALMDSFRVIEKTDPPLFIKNLKTQMDEPAKNLFPEVIFGNLLGDN